MKSPVDEYLEGYQIGQQIKQRKDLDARAAEDRKFEIERRAHELKGLKIAEKEAARREALQQYDLINGTPGDEFEGFKLSETPGEEVQDSAAPAQMQGPPASIADFINQNRRPAPLYSASIPGVYEPTKVLPHAAITIPGVYGPDVQVQPQTMQGVLQRNKVQSQMALQAKENEPFTLNPGDVRFSGGRKVAENPKPADAPPRPTEGEISRGLAAAYFRDKHKIPAEQKLSDLQMAQADAEFDAYKRNLSKGSDENAAGANKRLVSAVLANPNLYDELTPSAKTEIAADLASAGFTGFGKQLSETAIGKMSAARSAVASLRDLREVLKANEQYIGPLAGLQALNPYSEGRKAQADIDRVKQRVGKVLEGGVLRKEDEDKYKKILATLQDTPSTAIYKVDSIINEMERDLDIYIEEQRKAGRRVNALPAGKAGIVIDPSGVEHQVSDVEAAIRMHPGTRRK